MKNTLTIIFSCLLIACGNKVKVENYHSNGNLSEIGMYVDKKKHGVWKEFRGDGSLSERTTYNNGILSGQYVRYGRFGETVLEKGYYVDGKRHGHWEFSNFATGYRKSEGSFINGKRDGKWKYYDKYGKFSHYSNHKKMEGQELTDHIDSMIQKYKTPIKKKAAISKGTMEIIDELRNTEK